MHLKELKLYTVRLAELFHFYHDTLGMNCRLSGNELQIVTRDSLLRFEKMITNDEPYYHFAFNIPSNKVDEAYEWLKERVELLWIEDYKSCIADFSGWHAKSLYFFDPAGNIVEFISRFDLADITEEPFSPSLIRNVSETGLVFPVSSFDAQVNRLLSAWPLSYFTKQQPLPQFRAVGDDEGLLICVPENRNWYPLKDKPALIFPMEVLVRSGEKEFLIRV